MIEGFLGRLRGRGNFLSGPGDLVRSDDPPVRALEEKHSPLSSSDPLDRAQSSTDSRGVANYLARARTTISAPPAPGLTSAQVDRYMQQRIRYTTILATVARRPNLMVGAIRDAEHLRDPQARVVAKAVIMFEHANSLYDEKPTEDRFKMLEMALRASTQTLLEQGEREKAARIAARVLNKISNQGEEAIEQRRTVVQLAFSIFQEQAVAHDPSLRSVYQEVIDQDRLQVEWNDGNPRDYDSLVLDAID